MTLESRIQSRMKGITMTNFYSIPGTRRTVKTTAKRRYLLVTRYEDDRPKVDSSSDDLVAATALIRRNRKAWEHMTWLLLDQSTGEVIL
jgi:hypothetical protein